MHSFVSDVARRRSSILRFFAGVALLLVLGCMLAAVDLWGGVRTLGVGPELLGVLVVAAAALVVSGAVGWVRSWPQEQRMKRALGALAALSAVGAIVGGGLFAYYVNRLSPSAALCRQAACAATRDERDRLLDEGLGPLFPVIDPASECIALERERREGRQTESSRAWRETVRCP
jgi:hypothetical protein